MKIKPIKLITSLIIMMAVSCNEPETVVTNVVHPDGSVTRAIEMKSMEEKIENRFKTSDLQVPFDSTWTITDSCEISDKGDTTWIRRAVKLFKNVNEINYSYQEDSGANKAIKRQASFSRKFKWFNTCFRFSEKIEPKLSGGYPVSDFLNSEELYYYYAPESLKSGKENGADSLKYRELNDSVNQKVDRWSTKCLASLWIEEFSNLVEIKEAGSDAVDSLKSNEDKLYDLIQIEDAKFDSLWSNGIILRELIGDAGYQKFRADADTAIEKAADKFFVDFKEYSLRIAMPGMMTETNGYVDSSKILMWPVKSDFFLTETYEMWAESKIPNKWAWIVSGLFLAFVITGLIIRLMRRG